MHNGAVALIQNVIRIKRPIQFRSSQLIAIPTYMQTAADMIYSERQIAASIDLARGKGRPVECRPL